MGKLIDWVSNSGTKKTRNSSDSSAYIKLKLFNTRLARQIRKLEIEESRTRKRALSARQNGNNEQARIYMKSSLQFRKWMHVTEKFRLKIEGIQFQLEQAQALDGFSRIAEDVASSLNQLQVQVNEPHIKKLLTEFGTSFESIDKLMTKVSDGMEQQENASITAVSESEVQDELEKVDVELGLVHAGELPNAPQGAVDDIKDEIDDLEKEIKDLKAQRG